LAYEPYFLKASCVIECYVQCSLRRLEICVPEMYIITKTFFPDFSYVIALMFYLQQIQIYHTLNFIASEIITTCLSALHEVNHLLF
jgi:hypothetical protein